MRIGVNLLTYSPEGAHGALLTSGAAMAVRSLVESDIMEHDVRLVIVDNGSNHPAYNEWRDGLHRWHKIEHLKFVSTGIPTAFSQARNTGYRAMHYEHASWDMFLECDTDNVFPAIWFAPLLEALEEHPKAGIVSPGTMLSDHWHPQHERTLHVDYANMHYSQIRHAVNLAAEECRQLYKGRTGTVRHPPVLKRPACLRDIGLYDEKFLGGGWEDWDENLRALQAGWEVRTLLSSFVFHWTAWEHAVLGGVWQSPGGGVHNRNRYYNKWPQSHQYVRSYNAARCRLYYLPPEARRG